MPARPRILAFVGQILAAAGLGNLERRKHIAPPRDLLVLAERAQPQLISQWYALVAITGLLGSSPKCLLPVPTNPITS